MKIDPFLFVCSFFFGTGCTFENSPSAILGTWYTGSNQTITTIFSSDNTYHMDADGDGVMEINGIYSVLGEMVALSDVKEAFGCARQSIGIYKFKISENTLTLEPVEEACDNRKIIASNWIKNANN